MKKCVLFDMDGTLVNTYEGIYNSYKYALKKIGKEFQGNKFVGKVIGAPLLSVFKDVVSLNAEDAQTAVEYYRSYYAEKGIHQIEIYDEMKQTLKDLKRSGFLLGVATLKREDFAKDILCEIGIQEYFNVICGIDEGDKLTKAELVNKCLTILDVAKEDTVLVGDSEYDAEGAEMAKVDFLAVTYGFGFKDIDSCSKKFKVACSAGEIVNQIKSF